MNLLIFEDEPISTAKGSANYHKTRPDWVI